ncbi:MAG: glycosyltransferase [Hyphomicrobium sp.]|jgi:hypothetical protein
MKQDLAPIVAFVFNRPEHSARMLESLRANPEIDRSALTIYCDGQRSERDAPAVEETRRAVRAAAPAHARIIERSENFGLAKSIITGVTEATRDYGRVIVAEDDLVFSPLALGYFNAALDRYADDEQVMHVAGYMFPVRNRVPRAFFYREATCWGWATWARAWQHFQPDSHVILDWVAANDERRGFDVNDTMYFWEMLNQQARGRINSWAIRWYGSMYMRKGLALHPGTSFVQNNGFDGTGVHCNVTDEFVVPLATEPLSDFPSEISESEAAVSAMMDYRLNVHRPNVERQRSRIVARLVAAAKRFLEPRIGAR